MRKMHKLYCSLKGNCGVNWFWDVYDNEFERSMESKKIAYDAKLSSLFLANSTKLLA